MDYANSKCLGGVMVGLFFLVAREWTKLTRIRSGLPPPTTLRVVPSNLLLGYLDGPISLRQLYSSGLEPLWNSVSGVTVILDVHLDTSQQLEPVARSVDMQVFLMDVIMAKADITAARLEIFPSASGRAQPPSAVQLLEVAARVIK